MERMEFKGERKEGSGRERQTKKEAGTWRGNKEKCIRK
jgi:hypothetical protein